MWFSVGFPYLFDARIAINQYQHFTYHGATFNSNSSHNNTDKNIITHTHNQIQTHFTQIYPHPHTQYTQMAFTLYIYTSIAMYLYILDILRGNCELWKEAHQRKYYYDA